MWEIIASIVGPMITFSVLAGLDYLGARRFNPEQKWHMVTSWHLPTFFIWSMPLSLTVGAVLGTISAWGEKSSHWSAGSVVVCFGLVGLTVWALRYRFTKYSGKGAPSAGPTKDWRTNRESARLRYQLMRKSRWAAWLLGLFVVVFLLMGLTSSSNDDPNLWIAVIGLSGMLLLRWIAMYRLRRRI